MKNIITGYVIECWNGNDWEDSYTWLAKRDGFVLIFTKKEDAEKLCNFLFCRNETIKSIVADTDFGYLDQPIDFGVELIDSENGNLEGKFEYKIIEYKAKYI